jgi:phosphoribosylanthranilate isomerase
MKVKICGITNKDDAIWAINYGADFIGLNFYKESPRHVSVASAEKWTTQLPPFASLVGVFVNAPQKDIAHAVAKLKLKGVQLHGDESPAFASELRSTLAQMGHPVFVIKAIRVQDESSMAAVPQFAESVDYIMLDAYSPEQPGGTGSRFDWDLAIRAKDAGKPIFLAGGLSPENVKEAVRKVGPFAVDVASGVEKSPKRKDTKKMQDFITNAKR